MIKLGSLNLAVKDLDAAATFYSKLFGFSELTQHRAEHFRVLDANSVLLGLNDSVMAADYGGVTSGGVILSFDVETRAEVEQLSAAAIALGATLKVPTRDTFFGATEARLSDLDGHTFRIMTWTQSPK